MNIETALLELEKRPALFDEACRQVPDLFIARVFNVRPAKLHIRMQRFLDEPGGTKTILVPRNHGKTQQVSIGRLAWEIGKNPNVRIQVVQNTIVNARKTVRAIKETIESDAYKAIFPDIKPSDGDWGVNSLTVHRPKSGMRDSTVTAQPIFGKAGQRSDILLLDDIEDFDNSIRQENVREQVKDSYRETWLATLEPGGREWRVATPWHIEGITMDWKAEAESSGSLLFEPCTEDWISPWPEKFSPEELQQRRRKMGEIAYNRAFRLKAISGDEVVFKEDDLKAGFGPTPKDSLIRGRRRWAAIDLAFSDQEQAMKRGKHAPDFAVMGIADISEDGHVYMIRVLRMKTSYPEFKKAAVAEAQRMGVQIVKIESNGPQKGLRQDMGRSFADVGIIHKAQDRTTDKQSRAALVQHIVEQRRFHLRTDDRGVLIADMVPMFDELRTFPVGGKDDCFPPETLIWTNRGHIPICEVTTKDKVMTRRGWRRVLKAWKRGKKTVVSRFGIEATPDHRIWTENRGWVQLSNLGPSDVLMAQDGKLSSSTGGGTTGTQIHPVLTYVTTSGPTGHSHLPGWDQAPFIEISGSIGTDAFLPGTIFTTGTATRSITTWPTSPALPGESTCKRTPLNWLPEALRRKACGILSALERLVRCPCSCARSADLRTRHSTLEVTRFALASAGSLGSGDGVYRESETWDLTVETDHEFFANGVLAHNCVDVAIDLMNEARAWDGKYTEPQGESKRRSPVLASDIEKDLEDMLVEAVGVDEYARWHDMDGDYI